MILVRPFQWEGRPRCLNLRQWPQLNIFFVIKTEPKTAESLKNEAWHLKQKLEGRLRLEGEIKLADSLKKCGQEIQLLCMGCGEKRPAMTRCKQKWCPFCNRMIAARRTAKIRGAVKKFTWPLFITLTMLNSHSPEGVRELRRAFGKLRQTKLWKKNVKGGVAAIEVTNEGKGWHPHLHAVIDCEWLGWLTPRPQRGMKRPEIKALCLMASEELKMVWKRCLKSTVDPVYRVKRCSAETITEEVLKYSVKGSDLLECKDRIGPLIKVLQMTRMVTTFGTCYRLKPEEDEEKKVCSCGNCKSPTWVPEDVAMALARRKW